jgi:hypothetical protein
VTAPNGAFEITPGPCTSIPTIWSLLIEGADDLSVQRAI